jgi:hypothetical protein
LHNTLSFSVFDSLSTINVFTNRKNGTNASAERPTPNMQCLRAFLAKARPRELLSHGSA